jgi:hypothetical protein
LPELSSAYNYDTFRKAHFDFIKQQIIMNTYNEIKPTLIFLTVTGRIGSIKNKDMLKSMFVTFYYHMIRMLITNPTRQSKRYLLPFTIYYLDDSSTRDRSKKASYLYENPSITNHIHSIMVIHPLLSNKFTSLENLENAWRRLSPKTNGTLRYKVVDIDDKDAIESFFNIERVTGYSSKLIRRNGYFTEDMFDVLPNYN